MSYFSHTRANQKRKKSFSVEKMKRTKRVSVAQRETPELTCELWECIVLQNVDRLFLSAVFMLNKSINAYLSKESELVRTLLMVPRLNAIWCQSIWFICGQCNKLHIGKGHAQLFYSKETCPRCMRKCVGCDKYYTRRDRYFHRKCTGYPAPFTPHTSDDDELVFIEETEEHEISDESWIEEEVRRIMDK